MSEYDFRTAGADEAQLLRPLWSECFGDTADFMACYEKWVFQPDRVELALMNGEAASMLTVIPSVLHTADGIDVPTGCVYGVATRTKDRGKGLATRLLDTALRRRLNSGMECMAVVPDTPALFDYYGHRMNARTAFFIREVQVSAEQLRGSCALCPEPTEAESYRTVRYQHLLGKTYFDWDQEAIDFQREICQQEGGDLFLFRDGADCCAAVERSHDGKLLVCELLAPEELLRNCLVGLLEKMDCSEAVVRLPAWCGAGLGGKVEPFAMLAGLVLPVEEQAYWGFDFA